jgi:type IV pilus assembly protein PilA
MNTSALRPQTQTALMRQLGKSSSHKKNLLQKGFTLVELMIVIVIVGILSAIALPNFLSQSSKAKLTEAQQRASAGLKQAGIYFVENGTFAPGSTSITCADVGISPAASNNGWDYTCTGTATTMTISATGTAGGPNAGLGTGSWVLTGATGVITKGTADTTP